MNAEKRQQHNFTNSILNATKLPRLGVEIELVTITPICIHEATKSGKCTVDTRYTMKMKTTDTYELANEKLIKIE